jgi:thioredoxin 1
MTIEIKPLRQAVLPLAMSVLIFLLTGIFTANIYSQPWSGGLAKSLPGRKVTFIELGSVRCIPCQKMQAVMKSIEKNYGSQVNIIFYDVWTPEGKPFAEVYKINAIPTQVFLDENGKEYFRHEGYFPEEELVKVLKTKGVN